MTNTNRKANSESDKNKEEQKGESESPAAEETEALKSSPSPSVAGDNWAVEYKEGVGNHVIATRDIEPNEVRKLGQDISLENVSYLVQVIIIDRPAVLGPNYETEAVCLECLSR